MRLDDWPERLEEAVRRHSTMPFVWGVSDCFTLPMDCVEALTGRDPWAAERGYKSAAEAKAVLDRLGFRSISDAFAAVLEPVAPAFARRGDIGIADYGAILGGGVVVLGTQVLGKGEEGVVRLPRVRLMKAFRVE